MNLSIIYKNCSIKIKKIIEKQNRKKTKKKVERRRRRRTVRTNYIETEIERERERGTWSGRRRLSPRERGFVFGLVISKTKIKFK